MTSIRCFLKKKVVMFQFKILQITVDIIGIKIIIQNIEDKKLYLDYAAATSIRYAVLVLLPRRMS